MSSTAYVGLGSNLGDRQAHLDQAIEALEGTANVSVAQVSSYYETEPLGGPPGQPDFLNAVVELETTLSAEALLTVLQDIEQAHKRTRTERFGPRTLDLDLLLYDDVVYKSQTLTLPHPRMHKRGFVLEPLAEIAPDLEHPVLNKPIQELWDDFDTDLYPEEAEQVGTEGRPEARPVARPRSAPAAEVGGKELAGMKAVVTGSTGGIGRAIALELARAGAEVIIHGRRSVAANELADEIKDLGGVAHVSLADLVQLEQCRQLVANAWDSFGPIDIWINNAGADILTGETAEWPFAHKLRELIEVDVLATLLMSRDIGRRMQELGSGVIVNMGWDKADTGMAGDSGQLFGATKAAVMSFTKSLALSLAPEVRVNCLAPGWIQTAWGANASDYWHDRVIDETPLERWGAPEDVAKAARWLVSPAAAFITGQVIRVNGGTVC